MLRTMQRNIRWKHIFIHKDDRPGEYIPELHITSKLEPDLASNGIENAMDSFEKKIWEQRGRYALRYIHLNFAPMQSGLTRHLSNNALHMVAITDKNLCGFGNSKYL